MPNTFARISRSGPVVALGPKVYRKEMLRVGTWDHPQAPGGKLEITKDIIAKVIQNFQAGLRDDVPVPLGHDIDALENAGHVIALETADDGNRLFGLVQVKDEKVDQDLAKKKITGGSAMLNLNYVDTETGTEHGPTLLHWALTNAPFIKKLAPYEAVALGEDAEGATFIALDETNRKEGPGMDPIKEALAKLKEMSDEDLQKAITEALAEARPDLKLEASADESEVDVDKIKADAKEEATKELVAALSEAGVKFTPEGEGNKKVEVDATKSPEYVALAEEVSTMRKERLEEKAAAVIDGAIEQGKLLPAQKDMLLEIALSEDGKGLERVEKLIPEKPIVDLKEHGITPAHETNVELSEDDAEKEADRYLSAYGAPKEKGSDS